MNWLKKFVPKLWLRERTLDVDPDELKRLATDSLKITQGQKEEVSRMTKFLETRKDQNHFGEEFHVSFRPRES